MQNYQDFLSGRDQILTGAGFAPTFMPSALFPFQAALVEWSVNNGRVANFADCGLGKSFMQLVWAQNIIQHTNKPVLILAPLAVAGQTVREAAKFGIEAVRCNDGKPSGSRIHVTNYEKLHLFNADDFAGVVCDESSILKNFDGARKELITEFLRTRPYRLLCTATASPNDHIELGTHSEALGELGYMDMLSRFFKNAENSSHPTQFDSKWYFKAHAEPHFWRWVVSWARAVRRPSDLGFDDDGFKLPALLEHEHVVTSKIPRNGMLFDVPAVTLQEQRLERRATITERCELVARLVSHGKPAVVWGHLNDETDMLEDLIPDAVQVSGADSDEIKEERFLAFQSGEARVMVVKPKIGAFGLNWQHCAHMTIFPSHSFESYYQSVRRCWRFGQTQQVRVDVVASEGEIGVLRNLQRKAAAADLMFTNLVSLINDSRKFERTVQSEQKTQVPSWLI